MASDANQRKELEMSTMDEVDEYILSARSFMASSLEIAGRVIKRRKEK